MNYFEAYDYWISQASSDDKLRSELESIAGDESAIEDRFYRDLEFGTGGLRGVLGAGTNRMNVFTVAKATQGYCNYLVQNFSSPSVAIAYDSRINSTLFAETAAAVFAANGIAVYIYTKLMPTPALSFAVRALECSGGIVITASHNPAKYNGYKVYGSDGCQITNEQADRIQACIDSVDLFKSVRRIPFQTGLESGTIHYIEEDTVTQYLHAIGSESVLPDSIPKDVSIVYTPLNGAGISCIPRCLKENGFTRIIIPEEQRDPDGNFPTCPYPNPEIREALEVGLVWAEKTSSDLLLATDPDCDRVGAAVRTDTGYTLISGNEMGVLLLDFVCKMRQASGTMPPLPVAVKTIVTTPMAERVAKNYGVELIDVLTGFKFIGEQIGFLEKNGEADRYIFGFEESYGYLSGSFVRDKDAVNASLLICEMFAWYKANGKTLIDVLDELYNYYGFYSSRLLSCNFEGSAGFEQMQHVMSSLRTTAPAEIAGRCVERTIDYLQDDTGLPKSDVIRFFLSGGAESVVRPSGTEPKLKIYLTAAEPSVASSNVLLEHIGKFFGEWLKSFA